jgi:hypothetical protein
MKTFTLDPDQTRRWHKGDCIGYRCWCDCPDAEFMGRVKTRILDPRDFTTEWSRDDKLLVRYKDRGAGDMRDILHDHISGRWMARNRYRLAKGLPTF